MARPYKTVTKYYITVIDNRNGSKRIYNDDELREMLYPLNISDIRDSTFWKLLYHKYLSFECDEDYEILGLKSPNKVDWGVYYGMKV